MRSDRFLLVGKLAMEKLELGTSHDRFLQDAQGLVSTTDLIDPFGRFCPDRTRTLPMYQHGKLRSWGGRFG